MSNTLKDYYEKIKALPLKESYTKEEILTPEFFIEGEKSIELYYCTHNEHKNPDAKIFIVGITPGFHQMDKSIAMARLCIERKLPIEDIPYLCKKEARFEGSLRKNLLDMLGELELTNKFGLECIGDLFDTRDDLLHTTSMIPFATFVKGKNYTGHQPNLLKNKLLMKYVEEYFYPQVQMLGNALIIPLGKCVEEVLFVLINKGMIKEEQCLMGFPHPSGANAHRKSQFLTHKEEMIEKVKKFS